MRLSPRSEQIRSKLTPRYRSIRTSNVDIAVNNDKEAPQLPVADNIGQSQSMIWRRSAPQMVIF
jgi:hypothetical protein